MDTAQPTETAGDASETTSIERRRPEPAGSVEPNETAVSAADETQAEVDTPDVGASVLAEAQELVDQRRFGDAARVLESVERLRPNDPTVLSLIAVTHAYHGRNRARVRDALARLSGEFGSLALTWRTVSDVSAARFHFDPAQTAARTAVQMSPRSVRNWHALAGAYVGNGWFDEAAECMNEARRIDPLGSHHTGSTSLSFGQWQVGRAVNHWALSRTYVAALSFLAFLWLGLLGLALALSTPMLIREVRVRQLSEPFRTLADLAWRDEHRLRILNAVAVMGVLVSWIVVFSITR